MNNKGLTLIELLVTLTVSAAIGTVVVAFLINGMNYYKESQIKSGLQNELQFIESHLRNQLRNTHKVKFQNDVEKTKLSLDLSYIKREDGIDYNAHYEFKKNNNLLSFTMNGNNTPLILTNKISEFMIEVRDVNTNSYRSEIKYSIKLEDVFNGTPMTLEIKDKSIMLPDWRISEDTGGN